MIKRIIQYTKNCSAIRIAFLLIQAMLLWFILPMNKAISDSFLCEILGNTITEQWNDQSYDRGKTNGACPPYNRSEGRDDNTCLVKEGFEYPPHFTGYYVKYCAESTQNTSYFSPKIRVKHQSCNFAECWSQSTELSWDGQCVVWPGPYALPMLRICARVALPADTINNTSADFGYTSGKHLNNAGYEENDTVLYGVDGKVITASPPKLCAYKDPSLYDILTGTIDFMDYNPTRQPLHATNDIHPIAKVLIFIIDTTMSTTQSLIGLFGQLIDLINQKLGKSDSGVNVDKKILEFISDVIGYIGDGFVYVLKELGKFNRVVDSGLGCVEIPLGPYPPPFCPVILSPASLITTQRICETDNSGNRVQSTAATKCVVSKLQNNAIRNSIRVTADNLIPICANGENAATTDKCVSFRNIGTAFSASALHTLTSKRDNIKPCSIVPDNTPCVDTNITFNCSITGTGCEDGFRIVYGTLIGQTLTPNTYFQDDLPDCSGSIYINCQKIWGVNVGEFIDLPIVFPSLQTTANNLSINTIGAINDSKGQVRNFSASIVRESTFLSTYNIRQEPNQICVFDGTNVLGCESRVKPPKPLLYDCTTPPASGITCNSSYFTPRFIASMKVYNDSTNVVVEPLSINNSNINSATINLAGYKFDSFITDSTYNKKPFSGPKSLDPSSIYGNYLNNAVPFDSNGNRTSAVYLNGLEYQSGKYVVGGLYSCLQPLNSKQCSVTDTDQCVLAKLLNNNIIKCSDFVTKAALYPGIYLCSSSDTNCTVVDSITAYSGSGIGITIKKCGTKYCYTNNTNVEVCKISYDYLNRYLPSSSLGSTLLDTQFYDINDAAGSGLNYNKDLYTLRDKTPGEYGLCLSMPQPKCNAITNNNSAADGYATWPEAAIGQAVIGSCAPGSIVIDAMQPLQRYCLANYQNQTVAFAPLPSNIGCKRYQITLTSRTDTFPANYTRSTTSNLSNFSGSVTHGLPTYTGTNPISQGVYSSTLTFNIPDSTSNIDYFRITSMANDDFALVTVNNQVAYSSPNTHFNCGAGAFTLGAFKAMSYNSSNSTVTVTKSTGGTTTVADTCTWNTSSNINLVPYLVQGNNTIKIDLIVLGGGALYYQIDYKMK